MFIAPCLALLALVPFQESTPKKADPFEATLKGVGYAYKTDDDGDYNIEIAWKEEKRSQMIFVRGVSEKITEPKQADVGSREIWSLCWKGKTKPSADVLEKLAIIASGISAVIRSNIVSIPKTKGSLERPTAGSSKTHWPSNL